MKTLACIRAARFRYQPLLKSSIYPKGSWIKSFPFAWILPLYQKGEEMYLLQEQRVVVRVSFGSWLSSVSNRHQSWVLSMLKLLQNYNS
jgi:hypothetical protein